MKRWEERGSEIESPSVESLKGLTLTTISLNISSRNNLNERLWNSPMFFSIRNYY